MVLEGEAQTELPSSGAIEWVWRWRFEGLRIVVAIVVLAISILGTVEPPAAWEIDVFRTINDLSRRAQWVLWPAQQTGMALAILAGAVVLWLIARHWRPPVTLVAGGIVFGWGAAGRSTPLPSSCASRASTWAHTCRSTSSAAPPLASSSDRWST